jgi:predicted Zn-dependent protease
VTPQEAAERAVEAGRRGADGCVAIADELASVHVRWAGGSLTTNGTARSRRLTVIAFAGGAAGVASGTGRLGEVEVRALAEAARGAAQREAQQPPAADAAAEAARGAAQRGAQQPPTADAAAEAARGAAQRGAQQPPAADAAADAARGAAQRGAQQPPAADAAADATRSAADAHAPPLVAGGPAADWAEPPAEVGIDVLTRLADRLRVAFDRARSRRALLSGYAEQQVRTTYLASSTGLRLRHAQPTGVVDMTAASRGGAASWTGVGAAAIDGVDPAALAGRLEPRLEWAGRRAALRPGAYEVLLSPSCVADLMLRLYRAASAREAQHGQAAFARPGGGTRLGERLSPAPLTLRSDPHEPGLECAPFVIARTSDDRVSVFDNGLPLGPVSWLSDGVLTALVQTRDSARLSGQRCTAELDNLVLEGPGGRSLDAMVAATDRALLVTSLWYVRDVDPRRLLVTGLTRDGVYLIERGEVVGAVPDFRFNESPVDLLGRVTEIGRTEPALPREWGDYFTRIAMPPLRVEGFGEPSATPTV